MDASTDALSEVSTDTPAADTTVADGGGVCCPLTASPGCSPNGYFGGWAATHAGCLTQQVYDGCPFMTSVDSHGCAVLDEPPCSEPCGAAHLDVTDVVDASGD